MPARRERTDRVPEKMAKEVNWKVKDFNSAHKQSTINLINKYAYAENPLQRFNSRYWKWLYESSPAGVAVTKIAVHGRRVVGHYSIIPVFFNRLGKRERAAFSADSVTHPAYRRQGIFYTLAKNAYGAAQKCKISIVYGFANKNSYPGFIKKLNWVRLGNVPQLVLFLRPEDIIRKRLKSKIFSQIVALPLKFWSFRAGKSSKLSVKKIKMPGDEMENLWKSIKGKITSVCRDKEFINWRFFSSPRHYDIFASQENGKTTGYIVLREGKLFGLKTGIIVDWLCQNNACPEELLKYSLGLFKRRGISIVTIMMQKGTLQYKLLKKNGFLRIPEIIHPRQWKLGALKCNALPKFSEWFITFADFDVF